MKTIVTTEYPAKQPRRRPRPAWAIALAVTAAIHLFAAADRFVMMPLYLRGHAQSAGSWADVLTTLCLLPGSVFAYARVSMDHTFTTRQQATIFAANIVVWFVTTLAAVPLLRFCLGRRKPPTPATPAPAALTTRRKFLAGTTAAVTCAAGATAAYSMFVEPRAYRVTRRDIPIADLPPELDGLTLAQLTDLHHCSWIPLSYIRDVVRTTNALNPDLILLTGDYVRASPAYIAPVMAELAHLRARIATVATLGNHDWWEDGRLTLRCLAQARIPTLDNRRLFVTPGRQLASDADHGLCLAGVGDLWCDRQLYDNALAGLPAAMPRLLLSHNPDVAEERDFISSGHRVDLMLSGHTHGGQVWLPVVGAPMTPSKFGTKYARGLVHGPTTRVFISTGLGISGLPLRLGARPEIALLRLRRLDA